MIDLIKEYTVSQIVKDIQNIFEKEFFYIKIKGEITGFKKHSSGHCYFSLKDEKSIINAVMFKQNAEYCNLELFDGLEVIATGKLTIYKERSNYQIIVETININGEGTLLKIIQERKEKLAKEGLFDVSRKKTIIKFPKSVGLITAETGAALQDILIRLKNRTPISLYLFSVLMQGKNSAKQIIYAINYFNNLEKKPDVLVITRGGGSIEDLMSFNDECLVRAVAASNIPIISAIGHEVDWTLIDYASDLRLPTPTSVAEYLTISKDQAFEKIHFLTKNLITILISNILKKYNKIQNITNNFIKNKINKFYKNISCFNLLKLRFKNIVKLFSFKYKEKVKSFKQINIKKIIVDKILKIQNKLKILSLKLENYKIIYPILKTKQGEIIKSKLQIIENEEYVLYFEDGSITVKIENNNYLYYK